jgi:hypothetical protein
VTKEDFDKRPDPLEIPSAECHERGDQLMDLGGMRDAVERASSFQEYLDNAGVGRPKTEATDQPMPEVNNEPFIHDQVAADLQRGAEVLRQAAGDVAARGELGRQRYGTKLQPWNGRRSLQDAYEELLDGACYVLQAKTEVDAVIAAWCELTEDERQAVDDEAPDLVRALDKLVPLA